MLGYDRKEGSRDLLGFQKSHPHSPCPVVPIPVPWEQGLSKAPGNSRGTIPSWAGPWQVGCAAAVPLMGALREQSFFSHEIFRLEHIHIYHSNQTEWESSSHFDFGKAKQAWPDNCCLSFFFSSKKIKSLRKKKCSEHKVWDGRYLGCQQESQAANPGKAWHGPGQPLQLSLPGRGDQTMPRAPDKPPAFFHEG